MNTNILIALPGRRNWLFFSFSASPGIAHSANRVPRREAPRLFPAGDNEGLILLVSQARPPGTQTREGHRFD